MKRLPKHLRPRWRYLAVGLETWPDAAISRGDFQRRARDAAGALLGDVGNAGLDLSVLHFEVGDGTGEAVVRVRRGQVDRARAALACVTEVDGHELGLRVRGVAGTVRACEEKYLGRAAESMRHRSVVFENVESDAVLRDGRVDVRRDGAFAGATTIDLQ
ncbi:MAG: Rpp14/Pop5 family protein [Haloarculaceae archaeon]